MLTQPAIVQIQVAEPVPNIFEAIKDKQAPEEKTDGVLAADGQRGNSASPATASGVFPEIQAEQAVAEQDTRAPVGKDAGAAEHTGSEAAANRGGWNGGAEDLAEDDSRLSNDRKHVERRGAGDVRR
jgi:hypothetical protein